ncbi:hypothetical protein U0L90_01920 [Flavobacteriaceae sp. LMIT009]
MKILFVLLLALISTKECNSEKKETLVAQEETTIVYQAISRGYFEEIKLENKKITYCNDRNRKIYVTYPFSGDDWEDCLKLLSDIDISSLPTLEAPTSMREVDGAAHASLTIIQGDHETSSNIFDHGHPPVSIKPLVEKLLSIKKVAIKQ